MQSKRRCRKDNHNDKCIIVSRSIYDSECYIETYHKIGWLDDEKYTFLMNVFNKMIEKPSTVILNSSVETIMERLNNRHINKEREERNDIFSKEDSLEFVSCMHKVLEKYKEYDNVLYIEDNDSNNIQKIIDWVRKEKMENKFDVFYERLDSRWNSEYPIKNFIHHDKF